jgi:starch phosphorylase
MLHRVYSFTRDPQFEGRVAFVEDYDLNVADRLVQGVDLWLNLPKIPMEACGTSGMKAGLNAIPQLSTLDGWWAEGYTGLNGWALPVRSDAADTDAADAESLFNLLETEIVPLYYDRDEEGLPRGWLERMKHALFEAGAFFTASRMVREYTERFYLPAMREEAGEDIPPR